MRALAMIVGVAAVFALASAPATAQTDDIWRAGARVDAVASGHHDVWAAGALVSVRGTVENEIRAMGAEVDVDASAKGDAWAGGAIVSVKGAYERDLSVAGARVNVDAKVGGRLQVAGARVLIGAQTEVRGPLRIVGADVVFAGAGQGPAEIYGDAVQIDGRVAGDLLVRARSVTIGKSAVIDGNVVFETFNEPEIAEGAAIRGRQTVTMPRPAPADGTRVITALGVVLLFGVGAGFVLGLLLLIAARPLVERSISAVRVAPLRSLLVGLGVAILLPLASVVVMVTVIGIPVGILTLLAFPLLVFIASVIAAFAVSDWLLNRARAARSFFARLLLLILGLIALTAVGLVPFLGFLTWLVALLIGLGATWQALRAPRAAVPEAQAA